MAVNFVQRRFLNIARQKWAYNLSGYNKYGLMKDDLLTETAEVKEALRRIPQHLVDERNFRILRAVQLSLEKKVLPKEQWAKFENDVLYLSPMVEQVRKEIEERVEWEKTH